ncbi:MAG: phosphatase PAP2 family protein [Solirubrobacterales bacterium]
MSTAEYAQLGTGAESLPEPRTSRAALIRRAALIAYAVIFVLWTLHYGISVQRELVIGWIVGALACASIGRSPREIVVLLADWFPLVVLLLAYDYTRGLADSFGIGVHWAPMIDFDRLLFGGTTPTELLQPLIIDHRGVLWWDVLFSATYTSHFIVPFVVAGVLWARSREAFRQFTNRFLTLSLAGLATYILFPAAPPWMASEQGLLDPIIRSSGRGWEVVSLQAAAAFDKGQATVNLVAAVPSLHAGISMLVALFLWPRVTWVWRPLLALYPLLMGLMLIATGEHYLFDVLAGWLYAGLVMAGWTWWERRRAAALRADPARP